MIRLGVILIILGIFIPSITFPFASLDADSEFDQTTSFFQEHGDYETIMRGDYNIIREEGQLSVRSFPATML